MSRHTPGVILRIWKARNEQEKRYPVSHDDAQGLAHLTEVSKFYIDKGVRSPDARATERNLEKAAATLAAALEYIEREKRKQ